MPYDRSNEKSGINEVTKIAKYGDQRPQVSLEQAENTNTRKQPSPVNRREGVSRTVHLAP